MEETTGVWLTRRNGKSELCYNYYSVINFIKVGSIIQISRTDGCLINFKISFVRKNDYETILSLFPVSQKTEDGAYKYFSFPMNSNKNDALLFHHIFYEDTFTVNFDYNIIKLFWNEQSMSSQTSAMFIMESEIESTTHKRGRRSSLPMLEDAMLYSVAKNNLQELIDQGEDNMEALKSKIKKVIYVNKPLTINNKLTDKNGNDVIKSTRYNGMVKVFWVDGTETVAYTSVHDTFNKEEGFKTCVMKYVFGNAEAYDSVDFWTNKYVKYPSSCIEVTEALCKLEKILQKDKNRPEEKQGLSHAKFFRETGVVPNYPATYKGRYKNHINEFKKLAKKHFPEMKGKEIYINSDKKDEIFVAVK